MLTTSVVFHEEPVSYRDMIITFQDYVTDVITSCSGCSHRGERGNTGHWGIPATLELVKLVVEVNGKNTSQLRQRDFRPHASFQCPKLFC